MRRDSKSFELDRSADDEFVTLWRNSGGFLLLGAAQEKGGSCGFSGAFHRLCAYSFKAMERERVIRP